MPSLQPLTPHDPPAVGGFRLLGRLGEGGQGVVYLGEPSPGERVAVKLLRFGGDARARRYLAKEVDAARKVDPFCTARILAADVEGDLPYIVSEFIDGPPLRQVVGEKGPLRGSVLDRLAIGTATALVAIHQAGVVHRDFKPANVLLGPDGPRVIDFGVAHVVDATLSGRITGTPAFMAPEQLRNEPPGPPADMFAWGATIVYAATGRAPFGEGHIGAVVNRIQNTPPDLGGLDGPLRELVADCLEKDLARRPSARQALLRLLGHEEAMPTDADALRHGAGVAAPLEPDGRWGMQEVPGAIRTRQDVTPRRRWVRAAAAVAVGLMIASAAIVAILDRYTKSSDAKSRSAPPTSPVNITWFGNLGLVLRPGWVASVTESGTHVLTQPQSCRQPRAIFSESDCAGFWIMGPDEISIGAHGQGSYQPGYMYYTSGGVLPCPGLPHTMLVVPQKAAATEARPVGSYIATYSAHAFTCREDSGGHRDIAFPTQREWYLPERQVLIIDKDSIPELSGVLQGARWR
ncbi:serine/threonine-protein kinase [Actinoallomurus sp. NPDC050550]|uniref:serine/threonine-protein kinase n=1 Tax=Actinoallomurus sp. NPDC050550 TaxID=3154937 RepID=UPI0033F7606B